MVVSHFLFALLIEGSDTYEFPELDVIIFSVAGQCQKPEKVIKTIDAGFQKPSKP